MGRDTSDILSSGPIISLWDESKTTILRVTARHSGGMGRGVGVRQEEGTEAGARGTHSFAPLAFIPRTFCLVSSGLLDSAPEGPNESCRLEGKVLFAKGGVPACGYFLLRLGRQAGEGPGQSKS